MLCALTVRTLKPGASKRVFRALRRHGRGLPALAGRERRGRVDGGAGPGPDAASSSRPGWTPAFALFGPTGYEEGVEAVPVEALPEGTRAVEPRLVGKGRYTTLLGQIRSGGEDRFVLFWLAVPIAIALVPVSLALAMAAAAGAGRSSP